MLKNNIINKAFERFQNAIYIIYIKSSDYFKCKLILATGVAYVTLPWNPPYKSSMKDGRKNELKRYFVINSKNKKL